MLPASPASFSEDPGNGSLVTKMEGVRGIMSVSPEKVEGDTKDGDFTEDTVEGVGGIMSVSPEKHEGDADNGDFTEDIVEGVRGIMSASPEEDDKRDTDDGDFTEDIVEGVRGIMSASPDEDEGDTDAANRRWLGRKILSIEFSEAIRIGDTE